MRTDELEKAAMMHLRGRLGHMPVCPKIFLPHGWEADLASVSKTGMLYEFEIKTSRSDFLADFKKSMRTYVAGEAGRNKHDAMERKLHGSDMPRTEWEIRRNMPPRQYWTPNYFYFITPEGLLNADDLPPYAGLLEFKDGYASNAVIARKPQRLHKAAVGEDAKVQKMFLHKLTNTVAYRLTGVNYKVGSQITLF
jgi:hypothetical protein